MADRLIRIGKVSSVDAANGMISVTYPDLDNSTTGKFPVFSFTDEYKMPQIGQSVLVLHLSNGQSAGIVLGRYWNEANKPPVSSGFRKELGSTFGAAYIECQGSTVTIHGGSIVLDGPVSVNGSESVSGTLSAGEVTANKGAISLTGHTHTDSMGGNTGKAK